MYTMKEVCQKTGLAYETLKFYCNQGLVPNVKRDNNNYRVFNDKDIAWINSLHCLRNCGMSITEMKEYIDLCMEGEKSIPTRKSILEEKRKKLEKEMQRIKESMDYIDWKQKLYDDILAGTVECHGKLTKE